MKKEKIYDISFYKSQAEGSYTSAQEILPIIFKIKKIKSIVDIGCGVGTWLRVAQKLGCEKCVGYEGRWLRKIKQKEKNIKIIIVDLEKKIKSSTRYDLALSLEVAEHLSPKRARSFIKDLCSLSDLILFSAARPQQGGTNHLNEQPPSFWAEIFIKEGYWPLDLIRPKIKNNDRVEEWYKNNTLLFVKTLNYKNELKLQNNKMFESLDIDYLGAKNLKTAIDHVSEAFSIALKISFRSLKFRVRKKMAPFFKNQKKTKTKNIILHHPTCY